MRLDINLATRPYEDARQFWLRWGTALGVAVVLTLVLLTFTITGWVNARHDHAKVAEFRAQIAQRDQKRGTGGGVSQSTAESQYPRPIPISERTHRAQISFLDLRSRRSGESDAAARASGFDPSGNGRREPAHAEDDGRRRFPRPRPRTGTPHGRIEAFLADLHSKRTSGPSWQRRYHSIRHSWNLPPRDGGSSQSAAKDKDKDDDSQPKAASPRKPKTAPAPASQSASPSKAAPAPSKPKTGAAQPLKLKPAPSTISKTPPAKGVQP